MPLKQKNIPDKNKLTDQKEPSSKELEELGRALRNVYDYGYLSKKRLIYISFLRGLGTGFGIFLGSSVLIIIILWLLSFVDNLPILEHVYDLFQRAQN